MWLRFNPVRGGVGALLISFWAVIATGTTFPGVPTDDTAFSMGAFQLTVNPDFAYLFGPNLAFFYYPGFDPTTGILTSPVLLDSNLTTIGVSGSHVRDTNSPTYFPVTVGVGASTSISSYADYSFIPPIFLTNGNDEVMTAIESFALQTTSATSSNCPDSRVPTIPLLVNMVTAGPDVIANLPPNRRSIGMVQQLTNAGDFPAQSFFDIFVEVDLPPVTGNNSAKYFPLGGAILYNDFSHPLVIVNTNVDGLPPGVVYKHGQTTAVPLKFKNSNLPYWGANDIIGYLVLAGHGVFTNGTVCAEQAVVLDATLGQAGSPAPPMAIPWLRNTNSFPTVGTGYNSVVNRPAGTPNILDDVIQFFVPGPGIVYARNINLSGLNNPVLPPSPNNTSVYGQGGISLNAEISTNGTTFSAASAAGFVQMLISNDNSSVGNQMQFDTQIQQLMTSGGSALLGPIFIRIDPINASLGRHTIEPNASDFNVSSFFDVFFDLSLDNVNWYPANRSVRILPSLPLARPHYIGIRLLTNINHSVELNWGGSFTLQSTTNLILPFLDVSGPVTNAPTPMSQSVCLKNSSDCDNSRNKPQGNLLRYQLPRITLDAIRRHR